MNRTLQITRRTYQRLHKYLATPLFTRQKRCTARNECESVYVTERWAGGVRFGCLNNNLGKVAAAASLLLRGKIWNPPSSSCLPLAVDEAMDSLLCGIIFLFFFFFSPPTFCFYLFLIIKRNCTAPAGQTSQERMTCLLAVKISLWDLLKLPETRDPSWQCCRAVPQLYFCVLNDCLNPTSGHTFLLFCILGVWGLALQLH